MKKSYLMIAVAALAMASCAQDDQLKSVINNQDAINFTSFSQMATRATTPLNLEDYHETFVVYGTKKDKGDLVQRVFDGITCTYDASGDELFGDWKYDIPRYWDKQSSYNFAAFAPATANMKFDYDKDMEIASSDGKWVSTAPYTVLGQNLMQEQGVASGDWNTKFDGITGKQDIDIMISEFVPRAAGKTEEVNLLFRHTMAKLLIAVRAADDLASGDGYLVKIKDIKANNFLSTGDYDTNNWTASGSATVNYEYVASDDEKAETVETKVASGEAIQLSTVPTYFVESLVMPQATGGSQEIILDYEIESMASSASYSYSEAFTRKIEVKDIFAASGDATRYNEGYKYLITLTIDPQIITFDAKVDDWADAEPETYTIDY